MEFSTCFSGKIKNGILTGPKGQFKIPYTLQDFQNFSLYLKMTNFPNPSRWAIFIISKNSLRDS